MRWIVNLRVSKIGGIIRSLEVARDAGKVTALFWWDVDRCFGRSFLGTVTNTVYQAEVCRLKSRLSDRL